MLPLLEEGFDIEGFDASQHMLKVLAAKAKARGLSPKIFRARPRPAHAGRELPVRATRISWKPKQSYLPQYLRQSICDISGVCHKIPQTDRAEDPGESDQCLT